MFQWSQDGALLMQGEMSAGEKDGVWWTAWPDGGAKSISPYLAGLPHGEWLEFYDSGSGRVKGHYESGLRDGRWEAWSEGGRNVVVEHFSGDVLDGVRATWDDESHRAILSLGSFREGVGFGVHQEWSHDGILVMRRTYDDPPGADREERWWPSGDIRSRGLFVDGVRDGIWETRHEDGSLDPSVTGTWRAGERVSD